MRREGGGGKQEGEKGGMEAERTQHPEADSKKDVEECCQGGGGGVTGLGERHLPGTMEKGEYLKSKKKNARGGLSEARLE